MARTYSREQLSAVSSSLLLSLGLLGSVVENAQAHSQIDELVGFPAVVESNSFNNGELEAFTDSEGVNPFSSPEQQEDDKFEYPTPEIAEKLASYEVIYETTVTLPNGQESHWSFVADPQEFARMGRYLYTFSPESTAAFQLIVDEYLQGLSELDEPLSIVSFDYAKFQREENGVMEIVKSDLSNVRIVVTPEPTPEMIGYNITEGRWGRAYFVDPNSTEQNTLIYVSGDVWAQKSPEEFEDSDVYFSHNIGFTPIGVLKQAIELDQNSVEDVIIMQKFKDYFVNANPGPWQDMGEFKEELAATVVPYSQKQ